MRRLGELSKRAGSGIIILLVLITGFAAPHLLGPSQHGPDTAGTMSKAERPGVSAVTLSPEKLAATGIRAACPETREVRDSITVAGKITYDPTTYVVMKAPVDSVVEQLLVQPGQRIERAASLAALSSAELAVARAEVSNSEASVQLAQVQYDWTRQARENLIALLAALGERPGVAEIESRFNGKPLGEYRDKVLASYARWKLADTVMTRTRSLSQQGVLAGRTTEARLGQRDEAATAFHAACEQSEYQSRRELAEAEASLEVARRQLAVQQERLGMLLGPFGAGSADEPRGDFLLRAPVAGRIEVVHTAPAARLEKGDPILALADPTRLRVSALIHQHDWGALSIAADDELRVSVPAFADESFSAEVCFVGPEMSPTTRAVSLVAQLDNTADRLRPGMFVWVSVPAEPPRQALVVPTAAVQRHAGETFVFVETAPGQFQRRNVRTGLTTPQYVEITQGLSGGDRVVDGGSFFLKSELLLEQADE